MAGSSVLGEQTRKFKKRWSREASDPAKAQVLQNSKADIDLVGLRNEADLAKLPQEERKAFQALWGQADSALRKATAK